MKIIYNTSMSTPMVNHFKNTAEILKGRFDPKSVLEIGSNDVHLSQISLLILVFV